MMPRRHMFARRLTVVQLATTVPTTHRSMIVVVRLRFHHSSEFRTPVLPSFTGISTREVSGDRKLEGKASLLLASTHVIRALWSKGSFRVSSHTGVLASDLQKSHTG